MNSYILVKLYKRPGNITSHDKKGRENFLLKVKMLKINESNHCVKSVRIEYLSVFSPNAGKYGPE